MVGDVEMVLEMVVKLDSKLLIDMVVVVVWV